MPLPSRRTHSRTCLRRLCSGKTRANSGANQMALHWHVLWSTPPLPFRTFTIDAVENFYCGRRDIQLFDLDSGRSCSGKHDLQNE